VVENRASFDLPKDVDGLRPGLVLLLIFCPASLRARWALGSLKPELVGASILALGTSRGEASEAATELGPTVTGETGCCGEMIGRVQVLD